MTAGNKNVPQQEMTNQNSRAEIYKLSSKQKQVSVLPEESWILS